MNAITKQERAGSMFGVDGRFFGVVSAVNGRILNQKFKEVRVYKMGAHEYRFVVTVSLDDECSNGHETFAITADIREDGREYMGGCCHDEIAKRFPEFARLIPWHLVSTDGPLHYIANTVYHADEHGPDSAWIYYTAPADPLKISEGGERLLCYARRAKAERAEGQPGYRVVWDEKTSKTRNLDHARSSAVWPEATDAELCAPDLTAKLHARHADLMARFKADMIAAGFVWPEHQDAKQAA